MASIIQKLIRKGGRRRHGPDGKRPGIIDAGVRLLALKDFEAVSMARIAREAGCSIGALYARFPDKNTYLYHLVAAAYRTMADRAAMELDPARCRQMPLPFLGRHVVEQVVGTMTTARAAGVIRATIKLATLKPIAIELFEDYRTAATRQAVAVLAPRLRGDSAGAIRVVMQIVFATVTDAVLQSRPGPMAAGTERMRDALTHVMLGYLGVSRRSWAGNEGDGDDEPEENSIVDDTDADDGLEKVFDPDLRVMRKSVAKQSLTTRAKNAKTGKSRTRPGPVAPAKAPAPIKPAKIPKASKAAPAPDKPRRRRQTI